MPLKLTLQNQAELDGIDENVRSLYKPMEDGSGRFSLDLDVKVVDRERLVEMRNKVAAFGSDTPETIAKIKADFAKAQSDYAEVTSSKDADFESKFKPIRDGYEAKIAEANEASKRYQKSLESVVIDKQIQEKAAKLGAVPNALTDIAILIRPNFKLSTDGQTPLVVDAKGETILGDDGHPQTMDGLLAKTRVDKPYLFTGSAGGGSSNGNGSGGQGNIISRFKNKDGTFDSDAAMEAAKNDPAVREELRVYHSKR